MVEGGDLLLEFKCSCCVLAVGVEPLHESAALGGKKPLQRIFIVAGTARDGGEGGLYCRAPAYFCSNDLCEIAVIQQHRQDKHMHISPLHSLHLRQTWPRKR